MKRKITTIIFLAFLVVGMIFSLASCDLIEGILGGGNDTCNHENMEERYDSIVEPTCDKEGFVVVECVECGYSEKEIIPALGHTKNVIDRKEATCTEKGFVKYECSRCYSTFNEDLPLAAHTETAYDDVAANCTVNGYTGGKYCSVCDEVLEQRTVVPASGEHIPTPFTEDIAPTCGTVGYTGGTYCTVCDEIIEARTELPKQGEHIPEPIPAVKATCHSTGLTEGSVCSVCDEVLVEQTTVETIPHEYVYTVTTLPQYQVDGLGTYDCRDCDASYTEVIPALTYSPDDIWDGTIATGFASGTGTKDDPYIIETASQLAYLGNFVGTYGNNNCVNTYFKLGRDIILNDIANYESWNDSTTGLNNWNPIGSYSYFNGHFDGAGYAIRGMYCTGRRDCYGLFGKVEGQGKDTSITNLKVTEAYVSSASGSSSTQSAGGIIYSSYARNNAKVTFSNLHFDGTIISKYSGAAIVNWIGIGGHRNLTVSNRDNDYGYVTISECTSNGKIFSSGMGFKQEVYLTGIISNVVYDNGGFTMNKCVNNATIISNGNAAGLIGYFKESSSGSFDITITDCGNNGNITGNVNVAGLACSISLSDGYQDNYTCALSVTGCYNTGVITMNPSPYGGSAAGLACSISHGKYTERVTVKNCYNTGDVIALPVPENNTGSYYSASTVAGLVASLGLKQYSTYYPTTFANCFNSGNVSSATANQTGGLFAYVYCEYVTIDSCYNSGNVSSLGDCVGGIAGYVSEAIFTNVYNVGAISGKLKVGGIAGYAYGQDLKLSYAYNAGTVTGATEESYYVGAIVGCLDGYENFISVYYIENTATDGAGKVQGAMGRNKVNYANSDSYKITASNAFKQASYRNFDFSNNWNAPSATDNTYPTLKKVVKLPVADVE